MRLPVSAAIVLSLFGLSAFSTPLRAEDWPALRGGRGDGVSTESNLPLRWSEESGLAWAVDLPGRGNSSPVVTKRFVHLTSQRDDESLWVVTIDRDTGKIRQQVRVGAGKLAATGSTNLYAHRHNPATPTPVADDRHVWAFFGNGLLVCVDTESGRIVWRRDLVKDYGPYKMAFGMASSPRLWGDRLLIACMTKGPSYLVALNKQTGDELWKTERVYPAKDDGPDSYSSPVVAKLAGRETVLVSGSDHIDGYDVESGQRQWFAGGLTIDSPFGRVIASPAARGEYVVVTSANPGSGGLGRVLGLRVSGGSATPQQLWSMERNTPDSSTPVIVGDLVFLMSDKGIATCVSLHNGETVWQKRLADGPFHASVVAGDGKVYFQNTTGSVIVVSADREGSILAQNRLAGTFYATPAISDGRIYLRSYEKLYAISR